MKISYDWLQEYFEDDLPEPKELSELFNTHFAEVEAMESVDGDTIMDIDVLPNRACYALSHAGVAYEAAAITGIHSNAPLPLVEGESPQGGGGDAVGVPGVEIRVDASTKCRRYIGRRIEGVEIKDSPERIKTRLNALGQKSINNVVDATNYIMLATGQPLHAFDADKVKGGITVCLASEDERITTLDGAEVKLGAEDVVIADQESALAIAGIKGGKKAEVDANTKNIIVESANFDPIGVRRTSQRVGIKTDSSKRFENDVTPALASEAMREVTSLILDLAGGLAGEANDLYSEKAEPRRIEVSPERVSAILGVEIGAKEMREMLERLELEVSGEKELSVSVPTFRRDLSIEPDIAEEVGRLYGLRNVPAILPERWPNPLEGTEPLPETRTFLVQTAAANALSSAGYTEMYGYTFKDSGDMKVLKSLASDKEYLRTELTEEMTDKLASNRDHVLFDTDPVKLFEIAHVFPASGEEPRLAFGARYKKKKMNRSEEDIQAALAALIKDLCIDVEPTELMEKAFERTHEDDVGFVIEGRLADLEALAGRSLSLKPAKLAEAGFQPVSPYPRIIRDVALFVPPRVEPEAPREIIGTEAEQSGLLAEGPVLFDVFDKKDGKGEVEKRSLAYRLVFQSPDRTLSDEEVNKVMDGVYAVLKNNGWEIR